VGHLGGGQRPPRLGSAQFLHAYGPIEAFVATLRGLGFQEGGLPPLGGHMHYYRPEFDESAKAVLSAFDWFRKPLRPEDEQ
jgi:hypothetical protein